MALSGLELGALGSHGRCKKREAAGRWGTQAHVLRDLYPGWRWKNPWAGPGSPRPGKEVACLLSSAHWWPRGSARPHLGDEKQGLPWLAPRGLAQGICVHTLQGLSLPPTSRPLPRSQEGSLVVVPTMLQPRQLLVTVLAASEEPTEMLFFALLSNGGCRRKLKH